MNSASEVDNPAGQASHSHGANGPPRRNFVTEFAAIVTGGLLGVIPAVAGMLFYADPLTRKKKGAGGGEDGFNRVATLAELPTDGTPVRFTVQADKVDAWNIFRNQTIGTVYLRRIDDQNVIAFNDICPHLGCKVDYKPVDSQFFCPCHSSAFDLEGKKLNKIPPRPLDVLEVKVKPDGTVWVKYQEFQGGIEEKVVVS